MTLKPVKIAYVVALCIFVFFAIIPVSAQKAQSNKNAEPHPEAANRRTALICLDQSKDAKAQNHWLDVFEKASLGVSYDNHIPDLWLLCAESAVELNRPKFEIISYVATALNEPNWIQDNTEKARLLYADLLSDTCEWRDSLSILDTEPKLISNDADFVRAKDYYRSGNLAEARKVVRNAKTLYPDDGRFQLLFLERERRNTSNREVAIYAASLLKTHTLWSGKFPEILVQAANYSTSNEERSRLLKAYAAQGLADEQHTVLSLKYGIISDNTAFELMVGFAEKGLNYEYLREFVSLLKDPEVKTKAKEWLGAFAGVLIFDTNHDGITDLAAEYKRGRASFIRYDANQDGLSSWQAFCDFGVPFSLALSERNLTIDYGIYPSMNRVSDNNSGVVYELTADSTMWTPLNIVMAPFENLGIKFFIPSPKEKVALPQENVIRAFASSMTIATQEREEGSIRFSLLDGVPQTAVYYQKNVPYAYGFFEDGKLQFRTVDVDDDGFFELTETYECNPYKVGQYLSTLEQQKLCKDLFGAQDSLVGTYRTRMIHDTNKDGRSDSTIEFLGAGERVISWDLEPDGAWDIRSIIRADSQIDQFIHPVTKEEITIKNSKGIPVAIISPLGEQAVIQDEFFANLFWIEEAQSYDISQQLINYFNLSPDPGVSILDSIEGKRLLAVHIGDYYFGEVFDVEKSVDK